MKKKKVLQILCLMLAASMIASTACSGQTDISDEKDATEDITVDSTEKLNEQYLSQLTEEIESDIYGSLDQHIVQYMTDHSPAEYFTDEDIDELASRS